MKQLTLFLVLIGLLSCTNANEMVSIDKKAITPEAMINLYANGAKKWKITAYYSHYANKIQDEEIMDCVTDDIYTFFSDTRDSTVEFGDASCYANYNEVYEELSSAHYTYYPDDQRLYLDFGRGAYFPNNKITSSWLVITSCKLLTADKMIFGNGVDGNGIGIVFEALK